MAGGGGAVEKGGGKFGKFISPPFACLSLSVDRSKQFKEKISINTKARTTMALCGAEQQPHRPLLRMYPTAVNCCCNNEKSIPYHNDLASTNA